MIRRNSLVLTPEDISAYQLGYYSIEALARVKECSPSTITRALKRQGVVIRNSADENRREYRRAHHSYVMTRWKRLRRALDFHKQGLTCREIGKKMKVSFGTAGYLVRRAKRLLEQ